MCNYSVRETELLKKQHNLLQEKQRLAVAQRINIVADRKKQTNEDELREPSVPRSVQFLEGMKFVKELTMKHTSTRSNKNKERTTRNDDFWIVVINQSPTISE